VAFSPSFPPELSPLDSGGSNEGRYLRGGEKKGENNYAQY